MNNWEDDESLKGIFEIGLGYCEHLAVCFLVEHIYC
jgi:hypothetical protein